jgi:hypothetical protein
MDDTTSRLRAEFPLGDYATVVVMQPLPSQAFVLSLSRMPADDDKQGQVRLVRRLFSVIEALMGSDAWDNVVEHAMIQGHVNETELMQFVQDVISFDWDAHSSGDEPPVEPAPDPAPVRAAPRIVPRG